MEKFKITCRTCGSDKCEIEEMFDYNWFEELDYEGTKIYCPNCGEEERV